MTIYRMITTARLIEGEWVLVNEAEPQPDTTQYRRVDTSAFDTGDAHGYTEVWESDYENCAATARHVPPKGSSW